MIYEFCTYDVKKNKQDEFEILMKEVTEFCHITAGIGEAFCIKQEADEALTYVLAMMRKNAGAGMISLLHGKYGKRFERCLESEPRMIAGEALA